MGIHTMLGRWTLRGHLWALVLTSVMGFLILWFQGQAALHSLESSARNVGLGKDVVADILPPPLYLIEPHLVAHQLLDHPVAQRAPMAQQLTQLKQKYDAQNALWLAGADQLDKQVMVSLFGEQKAKGDAYWGYLEGTVLPLALAGKDAAYQQALPALNALYDAHRHGVDATVSLASAWADEQSRAFDMTSKRSLKVLQVVAAFCVTVALILCVVVMRRVAKMLGAEPAELHHEVTRLAQGDLRPSDRVADKGSVLAALQMAQISLLEQVQNTEKTNRELQQTLQELTHLVGTDALTGLWSRRRLEDSLVSEIDRHRRYGQPLSILFVDIDNFKTINDQYGHATGDAALIEIASTVQLALRSSDAIARWGGEEFLVLCPNTSLATATTLAERLRVEVQQTPYPTIEHATVSIGVAEIRSDESWQNWFERADTALYLAKTQGRNQVQCAS
jgi:diguanylate cyclase (GGDEF)-like protein